MGILPRLYCKPQQTEPPGTRERAPGRKSNRPGNHPKTVKKIRKKKTARGTPQAANVTNTLQILRKLMQTTQHKQKEP